MWGGGDVAESRALRDQSQDALGCDQFYALLRKRQEILEGVVERMRGELVQVQGNVSLIQGDLGTMHHRVDSLGQDVGEDISTLQSNMTSQLRSMDRSQLSNITQMYHFVTLNLVRWICGLSRWNDPGLGNPKIECHQQH